MKLLQRQLGQVTVLEVHGKMTGEMELAELHDTLQALANDGCTQVVLNLEHVPWIDSRGLGSLIRAYYAFAQRSGHLRICSPNDRVDEALFTIDLRNILDVYATESGAIASFIKAWEERGS